MPDEEPQFEPEQLPKKEQEKKKGKYCLSYLDFQEPIELVDKVFLEISSMSSPAQKKLFLKLGLNEAEITPETLKNKLFERLEGYERKSKEVIRRRSEIINSFLKWTNENNITPMQNIDTIQIYIFDNILGYGSEEKDFKKGPISQFGPESNAIYFDADCDLDILSHEYIHAASYSEGMKCIGFRTINEDGNIGGNQWLDEGCAVIGEHATRLAPPSLENKEKLELYEEKINVYEKGYLWLTKLFCKEIGWTEIDLVKAHFGQQPYRNNLEETVKEKFGCTIEDLNPLFLGYSDESHTNMESILSGEEIVLHTKGNTGLREKYDKLKKVFKSIIISE